MATFFIRSVGCTCLAAQEQIYRLAHGATVQILTNLDIRGLQSLKCLRADIAAEDDFRSGLGYAAAPFLYLRPAPAPEMLRCRGRCCPSFQSLQEQSRAALPKRGSTMDSRPGPSLETAIFMALCSFGNEMS